MVYQPFLVHAFLVLEVICWFIRYKDQVGDSPNTSSRHPGWKSLDYRIPNFVKRLFKLGKVRYWTDWSYNRFQLSKCRPSFAATSLSQKPKMKWKYPSGVSSNLSLPSPLSLPLSLSLSHAHALGLKLFLFSFNEVYDLVRSTSNPLSFGSIGFVIKMIKHFFRWNTLCSSVVLFFKLFHV